MVVVTADRVMAALYGDTVCADIGRIDIFDIKIAMHIQVLALDGVFDTGLATVLDAFGTANELAEALGVISLRFEVSVVGVRKRVRSAQGWGITVEPAGEKQADWMIVPAIGTKMPGPLQAALTRPDVCDAAALLRERGQRGGKTAAACIGTFILAESGLLDGQVATTTWWLAPLFRQRYPSVQLNESRMLVQSGQLVTAGAALSHIDMALWLIRQASPELAAMTARYLIVDNRPAQSSYVINDHLAHADPMVERFEQWARSRLSTGFSLEDAARELATSKRTLARRLHEVLGKTPMAYFQDLQVERAVHLLKTSNDSVEQIATAVGYADGVSLRALLRRKLGQGVRSIRTDG